MRYMVSVGAGLLIILFVYGFVVASGGPAAGPPSGRIVYIDSGSEAQQLRSEVERLRTLASIREVLEDYYPTASIEEKREVADTIYEACTLYDMEVELVLAVIKTESAFRETAVSNKGALGLMQVMPRTGLAMARELNHQIAGKANLFDRRTNIMLGTYYLKKMINRYGRLDHALLAYNAGPTRFDQLLSSRQELKGTYSTMVHRNMELLVRDYFSHAEEGHSR